MPTVDPNIAQKQSINYEDLSNLSLDELKNIPVLPKSNVFSDEMLEDEKTYYNPILQELKPESLAYFNIGDDEKKLEDLRYEQQGGWELAGKAVGTGILKGLLTVPQTLAYTGDLYNGAKALITGDNMEENELSSWLAEKKEDVDKAFPIYTKEPGKSLAFNDPGWWATMASSVIESGIGYGVSGGLTKAAVGLATKGLTAGLGKVATERLTTGISTLLQNRAEGKAMAYDTFRSTVKDGLQKWEENYQKYTAPEREQQEAEFTQSSIKLAQEDWLKNNPPKMGVGENAAAERATYNRQREEAFADIAQQFTQQSIQRLKDSYQKDKDKFELELRSEAGSNTLAQTNWNLVNLLSDYTILSNMTKARKAAAGTENIAEKLSLGQQLKKTGKTIGKTGTAEFIEESEQELPSAYYKQEALSKFGLEDKSKPKDTIDFLLDSYLSPSTLESGLLGGISGPIQHYAVTGIQNGVDKIIGRYKDNVDERIKEQKEVNEKNNELISTKQVKTLETLNDREKILSENISAEEKARKLATFDDRVFANLVYENNKKGTSKWLDNQLSALASQSEDKEAADKAKQLIEDKKILDKAYLKAWDYDAAGKAVNWINTNADTLHAALQNIGLSLIDENGKLDDNLVRQFRDKYAQNYYTAEANKHILKNTKLRNDKQQQKDLAAIKDELSKTSDLNPAYAEVILLDEKIAAVDKTIKKLNKQLSKLPVTKPGITGAFKRAEAFTAKKQIEELENSKVKLIDEINALQTSVKLDEKKVQLKTLETKQQDILDTKRRELETREKELENINKELSDAKKKIGNLKKETKTHSSTTALRRDFKRKKEAITGEPKRTIDKREVTSKLQNRLVTVLTGQLAKTIKNQEEAKNKLVQELNGLQEIVKPVESKLRDLKERKRETINNLRSREEEISKALATYELLDRQQAVWNNTKGFNPLAFSLMADLVIKDKVKKKSTEALNKAGKGKSVTEAELTDNEQMVELTYQPLNTTGSTNRRLWTRVENGNRVYSEDKGGKAIPVGKVLGITTLGNKKQLNNEKKINASTSVNTGKAARVALSKQGIETGEKAKTLINLLDAIDTIIPKKSSNPKDLIEKEKTTIDGVKANEDLIKALEGIGGKDFIEAINNYRNLLDSPDAEKDYASILLKNPIRITSEKISKFLAKYNDAATTPKGEARNAKLAELGKSKKLFDLFTRLSSKNLNELTELLIQTANGTVKETEDENDNTSVEYADVDTGTTKSANQLAWRDISNIQHKPSKTFSVEDMEQRAAFSAFINSPVNLKGVSIQYVIDVELMRKYIDNTKKSVDKDEKELSDTYAKYLEAHTNKQPIPLEEIGSLPIKVVFMEDGKPMERNGHTMYSYLHDTKFGTQSWTTGRFEDPKTIGDNLRVDKTTIYNNYLNGVDTFNTINYKGNPFLLQKKQTTTLGNILSKLKKVTILIGDKYGMYNTIKDGKLVNSEKITHTSAKNGGIYLEIPMQSADTVFPLKLQAQNLKDMTNGKDIANLIAHAYVVAQKYQDEVLISKVLSDNTDEAKAFKEAYDKANLPFITKDMRIIDLIQSLVYEGANYYADTDKSGKLYRKGGFIHTDFDPIKNELGSVSAIAEVIHGTKFPNYAKKFIAKYPTQEQAYTQWFMENAFVSNVGFYEDVYGTEDTKLRFFGQPTIELNALPVVETVSKVEMEDFAKNLGEGFLEDEFATSISKETEASLVNAFGKKPVESIQDAINYINNTQLTEKNLSEFISALDKIFGEGKGEEIVDSTSERKNIDFTNPTQKTWDALAKGVKEYITENYKTEVKEEVKEPVKEVTVNKEDLDKALSERNDDEAEAPFSLAPGVYKGQEKRIEFKKWIESVYPDIPVEIVDRIVYAEQHGGKQAYGSLVNGAIRLYQQAELGTGFHETFEAIWLNYLTDGEKVKLIEEVKSDPNYEARLSWAKSIYKYDNENDYIRETLAEEFKHYMIDKLNWASSNPITVVNKQSIVERVFKKLWDFIKWVFGHPYKVNSIFNKIATGNIVKRTNYKNTKEVFSVTNTPFTKEQIDETANLLTYLTLSKNKSTDVEEFTKAISSKDIVKLNLKDVLIAFVRAGISVAKEGKSVRNFTDVGLDLFKNYNEIINNPKSSLKDLEINKDSVFIERLHENLRSFGIIQEEEMDEEEVKSSLNIKASYFTSSKDRASTQLKLFLGTVPEVTGMDANGKFTYKMGEFLGLPQYVNTAKVWGILKSQLSDVVGTVVDGKVTDGFANMMKKLEGLSTIYPWMSYVVRDLQTTNTNTIAQEQRQTQFFNVMCDTALNHSKSIVEEDDNGEVTIAHDFGNSTSPDTILIDEWSEKFMNKFVDTTSDGTMVVDTEALNKVIIGHTKLLTEVSKAAGNKKLSEKEAADLYTKLSKDFYSITNSLGITLNDKTLDYLVNSKVVQANITKLNALRLVVAETLNKPIGANEGITINTLYKAKNPADLLIKDTENVERTLNPINNEKTSIGILAEADALFTDNLYEASTLDHDGNRRYKYSKHSFITRAIARAKMGDVSWFESLVGTYESGFTDGMPYYFAAEWMKDIVKAVKTKDKIKFNLLNFMGIVNKGTTTERAGFADMKEADDIFLRVSKILLPKPILPTLTNADKGEYREITGIDAVNNIGYFETTSEGLKGHYSEDVLLRFKKILASELLATRQAYNDLFGKNPIGKDKHIMFYHTDKKGNIGTKENPLGNVFKLYMFSLFNKDTEFYKKHNLNLWEETGKPFLLHTDFTDADGQAQNNFFKDTNLDVAMSEFLDMAVMEEYKLYDKNRLFENLPQHLKDDNPIDITAKSIINSMIAGYEYAAMFTGDPRYYKNASDYPKRVPASGAAALSLRVFENKSLPYRPKRKEDEISDEVTYAVRPFFNKATMGNKIDASRFITEYEEGLKAAGVDKSRIDKILKPLKDTNETDAQGYITTPRFREIMRGLGKWSNAMEDFYQDYIVKDKPLPVEGIREYFTHVEEYHISFEPIKGVHYELTKDGPVYLKYSQASLLPQFTRNTPMDKLRKQMEDNDTDEMVVIDGTKMGIVGPVTQVFDKGGNILDNIQFNKQKLSNLNWGQQQELPTNYIAERLVGSQVVKNMYANLQLDENYILNDKEISGRDLVYHLNLMHNTLSDKGLDELKDKLKYDDTTKLADVAELKKILAKRIKQSANYDEELVKALENDFHLDTLPGYRELLQNMLASLVNNTTVKLKQNGGTFIQMSSFGMYLTGKDKSLTIPDNIKNQIIYLKNEGELKPPVKYVDDKGRTRIKDGQILLPHSILEKIPNWREVLQKEGTKGLLKLIDPRVLRMIGYRIPNQGIASNDSLEVVGILPKEMGDMVLTYADITTKTGSDFDIDKMFMIIPNYKWNSKTNKLEYIEFIEDSEKLWENYVQKNKKSKEAKAILKEAGFTDEQIVQANKFAEAFDNTTVNVKDEVKNLLGSDIASEVLTILQEEGKMMTKEQFLAQNIYQQNSKEAVQNRRIELYQAVLTDIKTYPQLITSIDSPWLKGNAKYIKYLEDKREDSKNKLGGIYSLGLGQQVLLKQRMMSGQAGIGQWANQYVNHNLIQSVKDIDNLPVRLNQYLGIGNFQEIDGKKITVFNEQYVDAGEGIMYNPDKDKTETYNLGNVLISDAMTAYMNAFVDIAKDEYIYYVNMNTITNPMVAMLLRAGASPFWINAFMSQPIIKDYINESFRNTAITIDPLKDKKTGKVITTMQTITDKYPIPEEQELTKVADNFTVEDLLDQIEKPNNISQRELLEIFTQWVPISKEFNSFVSAMKVDVNGMGKNLLEAKSLNNLKDELSNAQYLVGVDAAFLDKGDDKATISGRIHNNSIGFALESFKNTFFSETPEFNNILNYVFETFKGKKFNSKNDIELANLVYRHWFGYLMSMNKNPFYVTPDELKQLTTGKDSISNRLVELKKKAPYEYKALFAVLHPKHGMGSNPSIVTKNGNTHLDAKAKKDVKEAFMNMLRSEGEYKTFAEDLIKVSFASSKFIQSITSYQDIIPVDALFEYNKFVQDMFNETSNKNTTTDTNFIDQFVRNNWKSKDLVLNLFSKAAISVKELTGVNASKEQIFTIDDKANVDNLIIGYTEDSNPIYKPYVKMTFRDYLGFSAPTVKLFRLEGYVKNKPIYRVVSKLGYNKSGKTFWEYGNSKLNESVYSGNNTTNVDAIIEKIQNTNDWEDVQRIKFVKDNIEDKTPIETKIPIVLTQEQNNAVNILKNFLESPTDNFAMLKGRGGTGKTTIIKEVMKNKNVLYIAPTHKAKAVLAKMTNSKAITLAAALGIDLDEATGKFKLNKYKREQFGIPIQNYNYVVIDESSMVSDELFSQIAEDINSRSKVIFMGDNAQLPPVGQDTDSKVFEHTKAELKTRMRQAESSPIIALSDVVANNVEKGTKAIKSVITDRNSKFNISTNSGVIFDNNLENVLEMFKNDFKVNPDNTKIVTFNNQLHENSQSVKNINSRVRDLLYPGVKEELIIGEQLTAYNSLPKNASSKSNDEQFLIENSVDYKVTGIEKVNNVKRTVIASSKAAGTREMTISGLSGYNCTLVNNITGKQVESTIFVPNKESKDKIRQIQKETFKTDPQMAVMINRTFADLEYGYTLTSHKAQGSTYRNVYVLEDNILSSDNIRSNKAKNQSLYVAITRASDKLVIHSSSNPTTNKNFIIINPNQQSHLSGNIKPETTKVTETKSTQQPVAKSYEEAVAEANLRPNKNNIPQNVNAKGTDFQLLTKFDDYTSSIEMIINGDRTRTTRHKAELDKYNIKVGSYIWQFGTDINGNTHKVLTQITDIYPHTDSNYRLAWWKEGWHESEFSRVGNWKDGYAIEFKIVKPVAKSIELGRYVKYNNNTYIVTQLNANDTVQIYNPLLEGAKAKLSVSRANIATLEDKAKIVTYKDSDYIVTDKGNIISLTSNKLMKWDANNGDRKAIIGLAKQESTEPTKAGINPNYKVENEKEAKKEGKEKQIDCSKLGTK